MHLNIRLIGIALCVLTITACSSGSGEADDGGWKDPAWFAEQAQEREMMQTGLQSCFDSKGWNITVTPDGGIEEPFTENQMESFKTDLAECRSELGLPSGDDLAAPTADELRKMYQMDRDTWSCLKKEGFAMSEPPSEDTYVEDALKTYSGEQSGESWWPYFDAAIIELGPEKIEELKLVCPERF